MAQAHSAKKAAISKQPNLRTGRVKDELLELKNLISRLEERAASLEASDSADAVRKGLAALQNRMEPLLRLWYGLEMRLKSREDNRSMKRAVQSKKREAERAEWETSKKAEASKKKARACKKKRKRKKKPKHYVTFDDCKTGRGVGTGQTRKPGSHRGPY